MATLAYKAPDDAEQSVSLGGQVYGAPQAYYPQIMPMFDPAALPVLKAPYSAPAPTAMPGAPTSSPCSGCKHAPQPVVPSGGSSPTGTGGYIGLPGTGGPKLDLFAPTDSQGVKLTAPADEVPWLLYLLLAVALVVIFDDAIKYQRKHGV